MFNSSLQKIGGCTLAAALLLAAGIAHAADAKIDKQALGQPPQGSNITVSPAGQHAAWQATQGSRAVMVVDGVTGSPFDELLLDPSGGTVAFSNDGSRYAYFGRNGSDYSLIVNGKEMVHGPVGSSGPYSRSLAFSPGGKHVFYLESDSTKGYRLVMDGTPGPWSSNGGLGPAFSPNDEHYAYNGPEREDSNKWFTVIDGKQHDFVGNDLQYTGDGRLISIMPTSDGQVLMVNGLPVAKAANIGKVWAAPTGPHYAAAVQPAGKDQVLYMDGKPVADCTSPGDVIFSSDGKHYAATCSAGTGRAFVLIDGKKGQEYTVIDHVAFAPDSATAIYVARNSQYKTFVVVGGKEFGPYAGLVATDSSDSGLVMSRTGGHYLFASEYRVGVPEEVVYDGKQMQFDGYELRYKPALSANGARYAFAAFKSGNAGLVVDGKLLDGVAPEGFQAWPGDQGYPPLVLLSPDGKHVVYVATPAGKKNEWALFVDDKPVFPDPKRQTLQLLAFTPDGKHLYWEAHAESNRPGPDDHMIYVDGKAALQIHPSSFDGLPSAWHMDADGAVQFLSVGDDGTVLRYRITPSSDTNVQTLVSAAGS